MKEIIFVFIILLVIIAIFLALFGDWIIRSMLVKTQDDFVKDLRKILIEQVNMQRHAR